MVQEQLGHHSHSFAADTYQNFIPGMDAAAADRFDQLVFGEDQADAKPVDRPSAEDSG